MKESDVEQPILSLSPIGVIRTGMRTKFDSPHQPDNSTTERNVIELTRKRGFDVALRDLASFDRIWLVWWFHRNSNWRPLVLPPRGDATRRGVFATRSPHRPNPIGITAVPLLEVDTKRQLIYVGNTDLVDGTPILDIKPYIPTVDAFPDASMGWLVTVEEQLRQPPQFSITYSEMAVEQIEWLRREWQIDFMERSAQILQRDPTIHRTRRIRRWNDSVRQMGCGAWRILFSVHDDTVLIHTVQPGYPRALLLQGRGYTIPDEEAQVAFLERWPEDELPPFESDPTSA
jgi:tRNA (adenine37-N6)-methyltransferase